MKQNAPIYLLRELLQNSFGAEHLETLRGGGRQIVNLKFRYIFRAWNAWRKEEKITKLTVNMKEDKPEKPI